MRCRLIRRSARSRSKLKVDVSRDLAFATDESRAEVLFERHLRQRVLDKLGVGRYAGSFLRSCDQISANAAADPTVFATEQTKFPCRFQDRTPPDVRLYRYVWTVAGRLQNDRSPAWKIEIWPTGSTSIMAQKTSIFPGLMKNAEPTGSGRACRITSKDSDGDTSTAIRLGLTQAGIQGNHYPWAEHQNHAPDRDQTETTDLARVFSGCVRRTMAGLQINDAAAPATMLLRDKRVCIRIFHRGVSAMGSY